MRRAVGRLLGAVLLTGAAPSLLLAQTPPLFTLGQAVDEALVKNDRLISQQDATTQAALGVRLARNAFQPKVVPTCSARSGRPMSAARTTAST